MKLIFRIVLLIISIETSYSQQFWIRVPSPSTKWFYSVSFTDTLNGWIAGDSGAIVNTSNAGLNWSIQNSGINYRISCITFINPRLGWGIANDFLNHGTTILKTTNGGSNWSSSYFSDTSIILETIFWKDSANGFLGGQFGNIFRTSNGGVNWNRCFVDSGEYSDRTVYKFKFLDTQNGFASGGNFDGGGVIWHTSNSGLNWHSTYVYIEPIFDFVFLSSQKAIGCGGDYEYGVEIIRTNDGGITWTDIPMQMFGYGSSISARTKYELWVSTGYGSHFLRSLDSGNTFTPINIPDTSGIQDIQFIDSLHGWAVGSNSSIYKFNKNVIGVTEKNNNLPIEFKLEQNYPNPFNPVTKIEYRIPKTGKIKLVVSDVLGKELNTLINEVQNSGTYLVNWDGSNFASGIYFYTILVLDMGNKVMFSQSKKMILLK